MLGSILIILFCLTPLLYGAWFVFDLLEQFLMYITSKFKRAVIIILAIAVTLSIIYLFVAHFLAPYSL